MLAGLEEALLSWVESANVIGCDFPIENLPFGVFRHGSESRIGMAIGDFVLDLRACLNAGLLDQVELAEPTLNALMAGGRGPAVRRRARELLSGEGWREEVDRHLTPRVEVEMLLPAAIGDYTDFYASIHHATRVGRMFRPDRPLLPNYEYVPIGYHGRASSVIVSGTPVRRPSGQIKDPSKDAPDFGPSAMLDYELEAGVLIGRGNTLGEPVSIGEAESHIFGLCLLNDWSARDIQSWEYQPLGPFLSKSFATTISPWVVVMEALEPFRCASPERSTTLPYLAVNGEGGFDIQVEVSILTAAMREAGMAAHRTGRSNLRELYWTLAQLVTHHTSNGCNLRPGDLLATGTLSGDSPDSLGCLLELTRRGAEPLLLPNGESRRFLEDGDEVVLRAWCERQGFARIGFGECRGRVVG